jgi:hypothetical protein
VKKILSDWLINKEVIKGKTFKVNAHVREKRKLKDMSMLKYDQCSMQVNLYNKYDVFTFLLFFLDQNRFLKFARRISWKIVSTV